MYLKVTNIIKPGISDVNYKGLNMDKIVPFSIFYNFEQNYCVFIMPEAIDIENQDILEITKENYENEVLLLNKPPVNDITLLKEENIKLKQSMAELAEMVLGGM